jgi:hypothetical protein
MQMTFSQPFHDLNFELSMSVFVSYCYAVSLMDCGGSTPGTQAQVSSGDVSA